MLLLLKTILVQIVQNIIGDIRLNKLRSLRDEILTKRALKKIDAKVPQLKTRTIVKKPDKVTVILTGYKRPYSLSIQLEAINSQTVKADSIMLWQNAGAQFDRDIINSVIHCKSNYNFGVWARFAYALNARTEFVCVFDDDTIPGSRWLENCIETINEYDGLLGAIGLIHLNGRTYFPFKWYGWAEPNEKTQLVDIVGHAWFFRREWLTYFWREMPQVDSSPLVGEDIHFSAMLKKYADIGTFVPPHPKGKEEFWGSLPKYGKTFGGDGASIHKDTGNFEKMNKALAYEIMRGFRPINY